MRRIRAGLLCVVVLASALTACSSAAKSSSTSMTLYTSASENVEQAVIAGFEKAHPGTKVNVFRAPTGQLNARVAADLRSGGIAADVIWTSDPLTMHGYDTQGLLASWRPPNAAQIPPSYRTAHFTGVDILYMVVVVHDGTPPPASWADLTGSQYRDKVAIPSPTFAASALGLLGYLAARPDYGIGFYQRLKQNGAKQLAAPGDVLTAAEQGSYPVGVTLANAAYTEQSNGSPIKVVWPSPGGVSIYAPIAITTKSHRSPLAAKFADYVASRTGQSLMAKQDTYVTLPGLEGPPLPAGSPVAEPNWQSMFDSYSKTMTQYTAIFGS